MASRKQNLKAIIYDKRGRVLSVGENSYTKSHTIMKQFADKVGEPHKIFLHAEASAIIKCQDLSRAYSMKIFRMSPTGKYMLAKPCNVCQSMIEASGIKNVSWTTGEEIEKE